MFTGISLIAEAVLNTIALFVEVKGIEKANENLKIIKSRQYVTVKNEMIFAVPGHTSPEVIFHGEPDKRTKE